MGNSIAVIIILKIKFIELRDKGRDVIFYRFPNDIIVSVKVVMNYLASHSNNCFPWNFWMGIAEL
jgi:hypothetical protein